MSEVLFVLLDVGGNPHTTLPADDGSDEDIFNSGNNYYLITNSMNYWLKEDVHFKKETETINKSGVRY